MVVELAQRNPGLIGHLSCRQAAIAVDQQPAPRRIKDDRTSVCRSNYGLRQGRPPLYAYRASPIAKETP